MARYRAKSVRGWTAANLRKALGRTKKDGLPPEVVSAVALAVRDNAFDIRKGQNGGWCLSPGDAVDNVITTADTRAAVMGIRNTLYEYFVRDMHAIRAALDARWGEKVRERDLHKCARCGSEKQLSAHHWCVNASNSRIARWDPNNGICLCSGCHLMLAHKNPDWILYDSFRDYVQRLKPDSFTALYMRYVGPLLKGGYDEDITRAINEQSQISITEKYARGLWVAWGLNDNHTMEVSNE